MSSRFKSAVTAAVLALGTSQCGNAQAQAPSKQTTPQTAPNEGAVLIPIVGISVDMNSEQCNMRFQFAMRSNDPLLQPTLNRIIAQNPILTTSFMNTARRSLEMFSVMPTRDECNLESDFAKNLTRVFEIENEHYVQGLLLLMPELKGLVEVEAEILMSPEPFTDTAPRVLPPRPSPTGTPHNSERIADSLLFLNRSLG